MLFKPLQNVDREDKAVEADLFIDQQRLEDTLSEDQRQVRLKDQAKREREKEDMSRNFKLAQDTAIAKQLAADEELARSMAPEDQSSKGAEKSKKNTPRFLPDVRNAKTKRLRSLLNCRCDTMDAARKLLR